MLKEQKCWEVLGIRKQFSVVNILYVCYLQAYSSACTSTDLSKEAGGRGGSQNLCWGNLCIQSTLKRDFQFNNTANFLQKVPSFREVLNTSPACSQ